MTTAAAKALDLVFLGTPEYAAASLRALLASRHRVRAVVTRPDKPHGRGHKVEPGAVKRVALEAGIEVLDPVSPRDESFLATLRSWNADLGVVVAYGRILPRAALEAPRLGCINAHASLLPKLRGAAPIERAILAGYTETGVTIMQMNEGLDEGDILLARSTPIADTMTGSELRSVLEEMSARLLVDAVDAISEGRLQGRAQDDALATFAPPLRKEEAAIRWREDATELWLRIRAFAPRPGAYAFDGDTRIKLLDARPLDTAGDAAPGTVVLTSDAGIVVACGRGALEIRTLQPEGKRAMPALDYARGAARSGGAKVFRDGN